MTVQLTPFEEQVLQVIGSLDYPKQQFLPGTVALAGRSMLGGSWGGSRSTQKITGNMVSHYPVIAGCLGRLRSKGFVERSSDTQVSEAWGQNWAYWLLTPHGCAFLGLSA